MGVILILTIMFNVNRFLSIISMVLGFIILVVLVNKDILDMENISIMYWMMGIMVSVYIILWLGIVKLMLLIYRKVFGKDYN